MAIEVKLLKPSLRFDTRSRVLCHFAPTWVPLGRHWVANGKAMAPQWLRNGNPFYTQNSKKWVFNWQ